MPRQLINGRRIQLFAIDQSINRFSESSSECDPLSLLRLFVRPRFIRLLHELGLAVTFNIQPNLRVHQKAYLVSLSANSKKKIMTIEMFKYRSRFSMTFGPTSRYNGSNV